MNFFNQNLFSKFIYALPNQLTPEFCKAVIDKFENDESTHPGVTWSGHDVSMKQSTDLLISSNPDWSREDRIFSEALSCGLQRYNAHLNTGAVATVSYTDGFDIGYQIQRTTPGGFYNWHHDATDSRRLTFIFYLNDVKRKGYTEFCDGTKVKPKAGTLLLFPATNQYVHRGVAPVNEIKYIMTGWIYEPLSDDERILNSSQRYANNRQRLEELEKQLPENNHDHEHVGGHTPPEGDVALSYGNETILQ